MAGKTTRTAKSSSGKTTKTVKNTDIITEEAAVVETPTESAAKKNKTYKVRPTLDDNTIVTVKNGFQGQLVYINPRNKDKFIWNEFGSEQELTIQELKSAKNSDKSFFVNNWFQIDDPEVIEYLGVGQYYKNALKCEDFENLVNKTPEEIGDIVRNLSKGQKMSAAFMAKRMVANHEIDSVKVIEALEKALNIDLIER